MPISIDLAPLLALPKEERAEITDALYLSLPIRLTDAMKAELDRRVADAIAHPEDGIPWEQVRDEARARHGRGLPRQPQSEEKTESIRIDLTPLLALPEDERAEIADVLYESVSAEAPVRELSPELKAELARRIADSDAHPETGVPWSEVYPKLLARCRQ
jgi:putative addiction module component (TIGR02574 family)